MNKSKEVTIIVPNYKTLEITKICLRLLKKHTNLNRVEVIVVDNQSNDESVEYLRSLNWITLIERKVNQIETGVSSHSRALDLALERVKTPYVLSIHTDTFIKHDNWLDILLDPLKKNNNLAGVGSWKLESLSKVRQWGHSFEQLWKRFLFNHFNYSRYRADRGDVNAQYLRSHCSLYRMKYIRELNTNFSDGDTTAGKVMFQKIKAAGYEVLFLDSKYLGKYIDHLNHATTILNNEFLCRKRTRVDGKKRIKKMLRGIDAESILNNNELDR